jgi:hypothetical protein
MQSAAANRRLLSTLSAKLHPQLPLSPRESQQLLNLLTTSFRVHLDREHPPAKPENVPGRPRKASTSNAPRSPSPARVSSSYAIATRHIDSILTNPLFAVQPQRRGSESAALDVFRDPMAWFANEIATGAASLPKAAVCLEMLGQGSEHKAVKLQDGRGPGSLIAEWLCTSGLDTSKQFLELSIWKDARSTRFLDRLVTLLLSERETAAPWRWFIRSDEQRVKETGLEAARVVEFRKQLLAKMVAIEASMSLHRGMATFMQAFRYTENMGYDSAYAVVRPAGAHLTNHITSKTAQSIDPTLYQSFLASSEHWLGHWSQAVRAMLWLHHPTEGSALPGLSFIQDPAGAINFVQSSQSRRRFLVKLCLGVAQQLLETKKYAEAQMAMEFTKLHFADLVLAEVPSKQEKKQWEIRRERANLELLDSLIPT